MMNTFDEYQKAASSTAIYSENAKVIYPALGLSSEVGEVAEKVEAAVSDTLKMAKHAGAIAGKVKKIIRDDDGVVDEDRQGEIAKELGDVLWYCAALASDLGLNLGDIARANVEKLASRKERGTLQGDGDNR